MGKRIMFAALSVVFSTTLLMCNGQSEQQQETKEVSQHSSESPKQAGKAIRFKPFSYVDKQGIGIEAFRMLMPSDWRFEGGIRWVLDNPGMPASAGFRVFNPKGKEEFEVFPTQPFFWTNNQMTMSLFPIGSRYFGNEVRPPANPIEALKQIVLPRFRHNVSSLRIVKEEHVPELARAVGAGAQSQPGLSASADGGKIKIEYTRDGRTIEEDIYTVVQSLSYPIQTMAGMVTNTNWYVDYIFSFKAEKGKLEANSKTFQTIAYSFKLNPEWFSRYNQVVERLIKSQIKQIHSVGELGRIISQTSSEIRDSQLKSYYERQAVNDKIADNFSQYIRGVDKYYNPIEGKEVELPAGYDNVWTNANGEYILTESPSYNPNIGSNLNWERIKKM